MRPARAGGRILHPPGRATHRMAATVSEHQRQRAFRLFPGGAPGGPRVRGHPLRRRRTILAIDGGGRLPRACHGRTLPTEPARRLSAGTLAHRRITRMTFYAPDSPGGIKKPGRSRACPGGQSQCLRCSAKHSRASRLRRSTWAQSPRSTTALGSIQVPPTHITLGTAR